MKLQRLLIVLAIIIVACTIVSMVSHFILLSTDHFNWLESPREKSGNP